MEKLTVEEAFSEAMIHDRHTVLGIELLPFCLDFWILLKELKSPLVIGGPVSISDLQTAVKVCRSTNSIDFFDTAIRPKTGWKLWSFLTRPLPAASALKAFNAYVEDYCPAFPTWRYSEDGEELKCPPLFVLAARLVQHGHDPVRVQRMALGELEAWSLAIRESQGDPLKSLKTRTEIEIEREIAREEARP